MSELRQEENPKQWDSVGKSQGIHWEKILQGIFGKLKHFRWVGLNALLYTDLKPIQHKHKF